jgi:hypothetical protein
LFGIPISFGLFLYAREIKMVFAGKEFIRLGVEVVSCTGLYFGIQIYVFKEGFERGLNAGNEKYKRLNITPLHG